MIRALVALLLMSGSTTPTGQPRPQQPGDFTPAAQSQVVSWQLKRLAPPSALYVSVDDVLRVTAATSQTNEVVTVNYRLLRAADGVIIYGQFTVKPASLRVVVGQDNPLAEGFLLSASCQAAVATTRGQTFVRLMLNPKALGAGKPVQMLMADYVTTQMAPGYPNGRVLAPTEGPGNTYGVGPQNGALGADFALVVPTNARWRVVAFQVSFVTSSTVATRTSRLMIVQNSGTVWLVPPPATFAASLSVTLSAGAVPVPVLASNGNYGWPIPPDIVLVAGAQFQTNTLSLQAGDQYTSGTISVEEWLDNV